MYYLPLDGDISRPASNGAPGRIIELVHVLCFSGVGTEMELYLTERLGAPVFFISGAVAKAIEDDVEREGGIICG